MSVVKVLTRLVSLSDCRFPRDQQVTFHGAMTRACGCAGGTFALYSLICRFSDINPLPNKHPTDEKLTTYSKRELPPGSFGYKFKRKLEKSKFLQNVLLILVLLGTCMVIGDGILTPAISGKPLLH